MDKKFNAFTDLVPDGGMTAVLRTVAVIGDSLASGEQEYTKQDGTKGYYDDYDLSWGQFMARKCGLAVTNYSCGGLTALAFQNLAGIRRTFYKRNRHNAYIIALGVNDTSRFEEIYKEFGSISDIDFSDHKNNKDTFCGHYARIIQQIKEIEPFAKIFVTTIPKLYDENDNDKATKYRNMHAEFLRALPSVFDRVYVVDLRAQDYILNTPEFVKKYKLGGHLSSLGYKFFGDVFATYIDHIICENPEEFASIGLVGTDFSNADYKK